MTRTMKISKLFPLLITFIILIIVVSGCSVVGLTIGAAADNDNPDRVDRPVTNIEHIKPGTRVEVVLRTDDKLIGKYKGTAQMSVREYESIFNDFSSSAGELNVIPAPKDMITIFDLSDNQWTYVLIAYNKGYLSVRRVEEEKPIAFLTRNISKIAFGDRETISGPDIDRLIFERKLPVYQTLVLDSGDQTVTIPLDSIDQVTEINKNYRIWIGLALGLAIDLAMFIWITNSPWNLS